MFSKKIFTFLVVVISLMAFFLPDFASAYMVSGLADLSYKGYENKIAGKKTSYHVWAKSINTSVSGFVMDPRLTTFSAGVGYSDYSVSNGADSRMLNYNLNTSFFPGMMVSWDLYGNRTINTIESETAIAGYDVVGTSYGAALKLDLSKARRGSRNNNNNNNNNNNKNNNNGNGRWELPLPNIYLSHSRTESESLNSVRQLHEGRDDTKAGFTYKLKSASLDLDVIKSKFEDMISDDGYETTSLTLQSSFRLAPGASLRLGGHSQDREVSGMSGFSGSSKTDGYDADLQFSEKKLRHIYRYSYDHQETATLDATAQFAGAEVQYEVTTEFRVRSGLNYGTTERTTSEQTTSQPLAETSAKTGSFLLGANYSKTYDPSFLRDFSFNTTYDFINGYSKLKSETDRASDGRGLYYSNAFGLGLVSTRWTRDKLALDYSFNSKRDHSPFANNTKRQLVRANASTFRIPRTVLTALASYDVREAASGVRDDTFFMNPINTNQQSRSNTYSLTANYTANYYLSLNAGATRAETRSQAQNYTLAEVPTDPSIFKIYDEIYYAGAQFNYPIHRNLMYRASARDEYRKTKTADSENYQVIMNLDYRIRMVFLSLEYRWRRDMADSMPDSTQQYYYARLSRPF